MMWIVTHRHGLARLAAGPALALVAACSGRAPAEELQRPGPRADERPLALAAAAVAKNPIATVVVKRQRLARDLQVLGSVSYDADRFAIVGPLVAGRVVALRARPGQHVQAGDPLAEIESADVGQAQAAYLQARARVAAAEANLKRERELAERRVSAARERELAEAQFTVESADLRAAEQRLRALGCTGADLAALWSGGGRAGRVAIRAPIPGVVIHREITLGQAVQAATDAFRVADLSRLWVHLDLFEKDLRLVHVGQQVELRTEAHPGELFAAQVGYVEPVIDEKTRTARVRVELPNRRQLLRPGQFVTARLIGDPRRAEHEGLAVPRGAPVTVDGKAVLFVQQGDGGFMARPVELGAASSDLVEVKGGVQAGDRVATDGAFLLKSELLR